MPRVSRIASLYVRLSRESTEHQTGLRTQEADLRALADQHSLTVGAVHVDDGESGALRNRPGLRAWLADAREGRADHLLAWKLDRVSRGGIAGLAELADTIRGVDRDGTPCSPPARFLSVADHLDSDSPTWAIQSAVMGALAEGERDAIRARILRSQRELRAQGRYRGGVVPYGFRVSVEPGGKFLRVHEPEAAVLREAADALLASGRRAALRVIEASAMRPRRAASWTVASAAGCLESEAAMSQLWGPAQGRAIRQALARRPARRPDEASTPVPRVRSDALMRGVAVCDGCGLDLLFTSPQPGQGTGRYMCRGSWAGARCPERAVVSGARLDGAVKAAWLEGWGDLPETEVIHSVDERADRLAALDNEIEAAWEQIPSLRGASRVSALNAVQQMEADREAVAAEPVSVLSRLQPTGQTYGQAWAAAAVAGRRDLLRRTVGKVRVRRAGADGVGRFDPERRIANLADLNDPK